MERKRQKNALRSLSIPLILAPVLFSGGDGQRGRNSRQGRGNGQCNMQQSGGNGPGDSRQDGEGWRSGRSLGHYPGAPMAVS